jgi:uncharacterized phiE125 gp8 family phage protein
MLAPVSVTPPDITPVSLAEVKSHLRVDHDDDDGVLGVLIAAAVDHLDGWTGILGRALVTQTWRQDFSGFGCLRLALGPVASIAKIEYFDGTNVAQELPATTYVLRADALGSYLDLKPDQSWPGTYGRADAVSVTYIAGVDAAKVSGAIKVAITMLVGHWYANREAVTADPAIELPIGVAALLAPYRRVGV